ncbi:hypothetical protein Rhein_1469 [Rheinheimera sp. A13L]|uniref:HEAT repeat domain-containing protein n=1 Tax=Rheinheimera sp. A13L TaxID=506534 RepID=UPI00021251DB|nr:HEAT repeat domain-containing protein [Rheinheimera sp. A13L]EGM78484.1 hypothetical protein Rhein_1469 [Rheinheimera sp. A13L]
MRLGENLVKLCWQIALLVLANLWLQKPLYASEANCDTVDSCYQQILLHADQERGIGQYANTSDRAMVDQLASFGESALPKLFQLLADSNEGLASLAAEGLANRPALDSTYLPQLQQAYARGDGTLVHAIAKIEHPTVAPMLVEAYLSATSSPSNQEAIALKTIQRQAVPLLLEAAACQTHCYDHSFYLISYVTETFAPEQQQLMIDGLLDLADNPALPLRVREESVSTVALLVNKVDYVRSQQSRIVSLCHNDLDLARSCDLAMVRLQVKGAWKTLVKKLKQTKQNSYYARLQLEELSAFGLEAKSAAPVVEGLLASEDNYLRAVAAETLLSINPEYAIPVLIKLMRQPTDAKLSYLIALRLRHWPAAEVKAALQLVASSYWYPPVRTAAQKSLAILATPSNSAVQKNARSGYRFDEDDLQTVRCELAPLQKITEARKQKLYQDEDEKQLTALAYWVTNSQFSSDTEVSEDASLVLQQLGKWPQNPKRVEHLPNLALRVADGWLTGRQKGEWGGELMYIADSGAKQLVVSDNIEDIYRLDDQLIATAGLAHLGGDYGRVYRLIRLADNSTTNNKTAYRADIWLELPSTVKSSWLVEGGELLLNTNKGSILMSADGDLRMAPCRELN